MSGYQKEIIDSIYDASLITSGVVGIGVIAKKAVGVSKPMAKMDFEDIAKLTAYIASSSNTANPYFITGIIIVTGGALWYFSNRQGKPDTPKPAQPQVVRQAPAPQVYDLSNF